jgi:hypothetical protein
MSNYTTLNFDGDAAGKVGAERLKDRFGGKVRLLSFPEESNGEVPDVSDWFNRYGHTVDELQTSAWRRSRRC